MTYAQKRIGQFEYKCGTEGCRLRIPAKQLENYVIPLIVIGFREATEVRTVTPQPDTAAFDQKVRDLQVALRDGRITTDHFVETLQVLEAGRPLPATDVEHLHLFDRWNALTAPERASEIRRAAEIQVRRSEQWDDPDGTKQVLVTPLVEGLVDAWWVGEPVNQPIELLNRWIVPKRFDLGLLRSDGSVDIPWQKA